MIRHRNRLLMLSASSLFWGVVPLSAAAQQNSSADGLDGAADAGGDVIIVTARKREESLKDIPLSITALSDKVIEDAGLANLSDIASLAPGLDFQKQGALFGGRAVGQISFRGMNLERATFSNQLGALFIDGIYVLGGAQSVPLHGIERVEVIKGPQNAYFGRNTFAGAINYITKNPGDEWEGKVEAEATNENSHRFALGVSGPITDTLGVRLSVSTRQRGSMYTATDGGKLGEETTDLYSIIGYFQPTDRTTVKAGFSYVKDEDTAPASTFISSFDSGNCSRPVTFPTRDGSVTAVPNFICGEVPGAGDITVSHNTSLFPGNLSNPNPANIGTLFPFSPLNGVPFADMARTLLIENPYNDPVLAKAPALESLGLAREIFRGTFSLEHEFGNGWSFQASAGYNELRGSFTNDLDRTDVEGNLGIFPLGFKDYTIEGVLRSDQSNPFSWLIGASYYNQEVLADLTTGYFINPAAFIGAGGFGLPADTISVFDSPPLNQDSDEGTVFGVFAAVHYDITDRLAIDLEGRFQSDEVKRFGIRSADDATTAKFEDFLPRVILTYKPADNTTIYGSWSKGVLPGDINFVFIGQSQAGRDILTNIEPTASEVLDSEELHSFEIGIKQSLFNNRLTYSLAAYYMDWANLKAFTQGNLTPAQQIELNSTNPIVSLTIPADAELKGIELDGAYEATDNLALGFTFNWADSEYTDYVLADYGLILGVPGTGIQFAGNTVQNFPTTSGSVSATYTKQMSGNWQWYARADVFYRGKTYLDPGNLAYINGHATANLRVGILLDSVRLEAFVTNLTNNDRFVSGRRLNDNVHRVGNIGFGGSGPTPGPASFGPVYGAFTSNQGLVFEAPDKRQVGLRASYTF